MIHVRLEALSGAVAIHSEALVEPGQLQLVNPLRQVRAQAPEQFCGGFGVVLDDAVLISVERIVGRESRRRALDKFLGLTQKADL
jgi:hypothetical protein